MSEAAAAVGFVKVQRQGLFPYFYGQLFPCALCRFVTVSEYSEAILSFKTKRRSASGGLTGNTPPCRFLCSDLLT